MPITEQLVWEKYSGLMKTSKHNFSFLSLLMSAKGYHSQKNLKKVSCAMVFGNGVMQKCGLLITLQHLKLKVVKLTQTKLSPIWNDVLGSSWWYH